MRDEKNNDKMSEVIRAVRETLAGSSSMNVNDILKKLSKSHLQSMKLSKEDLMDVLNYYKSLDVVYLDQDENVVFL